MRSIARSIAEHRLIACTVGLVATVLALATALAISDLAEVETSDLLANLMYWVGGSVGFLLVGSIILVQRPGHRIGRLMLLMGVSPALSQGVVTILGAIDPDGARWGAITTPLLAVVGAMGFLVIVTGALLLVVWFPDGRTTSRLGTMVQALVLVLLIGQVVMVLDPTMFGEWAFGFVLLLGTYALALMDLLVRYRRSDGVHRTQIRWVLASGAVTTALIVALLAFGDRFWWLWPLWLASTLLPAVAIAIAITRYRLYEIDRIISRTLGYGLVTAVLFVVFGAVNLGLQGILSEATRSQPLIVAASTLLVAALFNPLRVRVQRIVDRRFNRARYDAERTVEQFSGRLRDELDLATLTDALQDTTRAVVEPSSAGVWLRSGGAR